MEYIDEIRSFTEQLKFDKSLEAPKGARNIVIAGMGGSGIVGNVFKELYTEQPVITTDDYEIPSFINSSTFFIAISYSGNTEETIAALAKAKSRGAKIAAITSGGKLAQEVNNAVIVPKGLQPRAALVYMLMPLVHGFGAAGKEQIDDAYRVCKALDADNGAEEKVGRAIFDNEAIPVIYSVYPYKTVSYRWKTQFNENAKVLAYSSSFPELNHNDTMALKQTYGKKRFHFLALVDGQNGFGEKRLAITERITGTPFTKIMAHGGSTFSRAMSLIHKGDYVSYHLARYRKVNPQDVSIIEELKAELAK